MKNLNSMVIKFVIINFLDVIERMNRLESLEK